MSYLYSSCWPVFGSMTELAARMSGNGSANSPSCFVGYCDSKFTIIGMIRCLWLCWMSLGGSETISSTCFGSSVGLDLVWKSVVPCGAVRAAFASYLVLLRGRGRGGWVGGWVGGCWWWCLWWFMYNAWQPRH